MTGIVRNISYIQDNLHQPLTLIGLMASGKSRLARELGRLTDLAYCDCDQEIEAAAGCSIPDIFEIYGEDAFRDVEARVMERLVRARDISIIATGGGAVMTPHIADLVFEETISIWVKAPIDVMAQRAARNDKRPLLKETQDPQARLKALAEKRYPVYEKADICIENDEDTMPGDMAHQALNALTDLLSSRTHA